jgi:hypothetical protein
MTLTVVYAIQFKLLDRILTTEELLKDMSC